MHRGFLRFGAVFGMLSVILGAMAAHTLKGKISAYSLDIFETAVKYQFYHAIALILTGILFRSFSGRLLKAAGWCFVIGIVFFSGSLYALAAVKATVQPGFRWLGPVTPIGGVFFIAGWALMLAAFFQKPVDNR